MDHKLAKFIVDRYVALIRDLRPHAIVQSNGLLGRASATVKYAHFVYGEYLVQERLITNDDLFVLMESFGLLESYFVDDPETINASYRDHITQLHCGIITEFQIPNPFGSTYSVNEYYNFIGDCLCRFGLGRLSDKPLGAFIFEGVRAKAVVEKDIKTLIGLAESGITRAIKLQ